MRILSPTCSSGSPGLSLITRRVRLPALSPASMETMARSHLLGCSSSGEIGATSNALPIEGELQAPVSRIATVPLTWFAGSALVLASSGDTLGSELLGHSITTPTAVAMPAITSSTARTHCHMVKGVFFLLSVSTGLTGASCDCEPSGRISFGVRRRCRSCLIRVLLVDDSSPAPFPRRVLVVRGLLERGASSRVCGGVTRVCEVRGCAVRLLAGLCSVCSVWSAIGRGVGRWVTR